MFTLLTLRWTQTLTNVFLFSTIISKGSEEQVGYWLYRWVICL